MNKKLNEKLEKAFWVCWDCGTKHGRAKNGGMSTMHIEMCDVCGESKPVTHVRNFNYLRK